MSEWQPVIGLEVHAQLSTRSKLFSGASTATGAEPNVNACAVDLGLPGVLPVLNEAALEMAVRFGLAVGARINRRSVFARKNYFYPDLPKGYQISQYERPIVEGGAVRLPGATGTLREVALTRAHLEEDAGKSLHDQFAGLTAIDLNRAGTPLLEIVSEPQMHSAAEAVLYLRAVHQLVRYLGICDGNMQDGSFRCDANVSVRRGPQAPYGVRTEIKNLNSFRFIEKAIDFEIERQIDALESGRAVHQETRLYDPERNETRPMRSKEDAEDYRYFPDPDLLPLVVDEARLARIAAELPELPEPRLRRFVTQYAMGEEEALTLTSSRALADYFEAVVVASGGEVRLACNWVLTELTGAMHRDSRDIDACPVTPEQLGALVHRIADGTISGKIAKDLFDRLWREGGEPDEIIARDGLRQVTDTDFIRAIAQEVVARHPKQLEQYRSGKTKLLGFFVGQALKLSEGKANPQQLNEALLEILSAPER